MLYYLSVKLSLTLLTAVALLFLKTCAHILGWNDLKISVNSEISPKFAIKFTNYVLLCLTLLAFIFVFFLVLFCFFVCFFLVSSGVTRFLFCKMVNKPHCYARAAIFLTCCISLHACAGNLQCRRVRSIYGMMLRGHVFQEHNAANILACSLLCNSNIRCQSINYVMSRHVCELNSKTREARPKDYLQDADRVYLTRSRERGIQLALVLLAIYERKLWPH